MEKEYQDLKNSNIINISSDEENTWDQIQASDSNSFQKDFEEFKKFVTGELQKIDSRFTAISKDISPANQGENHNQNRQQNRQQKIKMGQQRTQIMQKGPSPVINQQPENQNTFKRKIPNNSQNTGYRDAGLIKK